MHMSDALLSPGIAAATMAMSAATVGVGINRVKKDESESKLPVMATAAALVFAGQMINYSIPGTGASGHICGGVLLSALLGPWAAFLSMTAILMVQCFLFADGGVLALGANIWNMGFYGCIVGYYLFWKPIVLRRAAVSPGSAGLTTQRVCIANEHHASSADSINLTRRIILASILACILTLQLGSISVVFETTLSGITSLPISIFAAIMQPIHLAIGLVEGLVTAAILTFVYKARPSMLTGDFVASPASASDRQPHDSKNASGPKSREDKTSRRTVLTILATLAAILAGFLSIFASGNPDGLEWSIEKTSQDFAEKIAGADGYGNPSVSGLIGCVACIVVLALLAFAIKKLKLEIKNAGLRIALLIVYIAMLMTFDRYNVIGTFAFAMIAVAIFAGNKMPLRKFIYDMRHMLLIVLAAGALNPVFDGGVSSMLTVFIKGVAVLMATYTFINKTQIESILASLRRIHAPKILISLILLMYRYFHVMHDEIENMKTAYKLRGGGKGIKPLAWGSFLGGAFLRSSDRAGDIYDAMKLRGYCGEFYYITQEKITTLEIITAIILVAALIALRYFGCA